MEVPVKSIIFIFIIIIIVILTVIIIIIIIIIYFHCNTRNRFYESLSNWKTFIDPNSAQWLYLCPTDFGNDKCRPRIRLFTTFENKFR